MAAVAAVGDAWFPVTGGGVLSRPTGTLVGAASFTVSCLGSALLVTQLPTGAVADVVYGSPTATVEPVTVEETSASADLGSGHSKIVESRGDSYSVSVRD